MYKQQATKPLTSTLQVYGMSECCGATTISTNPEHRWGSIGFSMAGCETRVFRVADGASSKLIESTSTLPALYNCNTMHRYSC
jgi:hypothetical protein